MLARLRLSKGSLIGKIFSKRWGLILAITFLLFAAAGVGVFAYYYNYYAKQIDAKLKAGAFTNLTMLYAAPEPIAVDDPASTEEIAAYLRRCGYSESNSSRMGWYHVRNDNAIEINPGPDARDSEGAVVKIAQGKVTQIISLRDNTERTRYLLEPELISNLFDAKREKRRLVHFDDIPKAVYNAVRAAEDEHFEDHAGFDPIGIIRAAVNDVLSGKRLEGASTISQQLARTLGDLGTKRGFGRKIPETLITMHLEQTMNKHQIFEAYANSIDLGHQGSFWIRGFGEAAQVYLGKDLSKVTSPADAALLAGLIQAPSARNPFAHPDKAKARRDTVLKMMLNNNFVTQKDYEEAVATPLKVTREAVESNDAPYFVDMVNEELQTRLPEDDFKNNAYRIDTTIDMELQHDAVAAVRVGLPETDAQWKRRNKKYGTDDFPLAQTALIAVSAETGELLAIVGGRSYGVSQLNHALAKRQPGSSFKPIVYAAAMATALDTNAKTVFTPATRIVDEATTFYFDNQPPYEPKDFDKFKGEVSLREALAHSMNVPAVKLAEAVGYDTVADTAHRLGLNFDIKPTPSIALGAYEVKPIEIAGAYTAFVNRGDVLKTNYIKDIRDKSGRVVYETKPERKNAIDPRVAYIVENMMEEVLRSGTGAAARSKYNFTLPAAGKTGTSRDGWFVGFTTKIICAVWVGFDDNRDFKLEGAHSALPIWVEFMKRAHQHRGYKNVRQFEEPEGIVRADIDVDSGELATPNCPLSKVHEEVFIAGSQPLQVCHLHGGAGGRTTISSWEPVQQTPHADETPAVSRNQRPASQPRSIPVAPPAAPQQPAQDQDKAKGIWGFIKGLIKR